MLNELLSRGYFPKELPAPFNTRSFANAVTTAKTLPADFSKKDGKGASLARLGRYSLARGGLFRRPLSICNPIHYFHLCKTISDEWSSILPKVAGTKISATHPEPKPSGRAINGKYSQGDRSKMAQSTRLGRRFLLQTDISRFYNSIYTHSIPWALHGKATAKANHGENLIGNKLDRLVRQGQDQQTIGIPIGPDTSLVLSELIMHRCDEELLTKLPDIQGHRFIDDYELSFKTRNAAEDAFHALESCLSHFELALNPKKTRVVELPAPLELSWARSLKRFPIKDSISGQAADLEYYFSLAFDLHKSTDPEESVLQFSLARLRSIKIHPGNWENLQKLMLLCVTPEPASFPYALQLIVQQKNTGAPILSDSLEEVVNNLIVEHSSLLHSSEVANALWACLALKLKLSKAAVDAVSSCDDPVVALLALDCSANGLVSSPINTTLWSAHMTAEGLYGSHWLLSYEANVKGWLPSADGGDHVASDPNFGFLKALNVSFYDVALASPTPTTPIPAPVVPTPTPTLTPFPFTSIP